MLPQSLQNLTDKKSRGRNLYTEDFQIALDLMNAGENVTFKHPTTGIIPESGLKQLQEYMKASGRNVADVMQMFDTGSQAGINRLLNAANGAYVMTDADEAENKRLIERQKLAFAKNPNKFLRPEQPASSESIRLSPSYNSNQQNQSATDYIQSSVTAPKAPSGGLGKQQANIAEGNRVRASGPNVANKGNVKLQEATSNENILRVIIDSPLALMEYLNELKAAGDTKKLKTAGDAVLKHYKGIANFRERLREEQQFVSKGIGSSNKGRAAGDEKHYNKPDTSWLKHPNAQTQQPQQESRTGTTAKELYNLGKDAEKKEEVKKAVTKAKKKSRVVQDYNYPGDKKITEISQKATRPNYEYAGNADDNVLDNDVRNPARTFRIAFAKADEGSIFEVNGQTYRKI